MCIGWAVGDVIYFAIAEQLGSSDPFRDWPTLSLLIVVQHDRADGRVDAIPRHGLAADGRDGGRDGRPRDVDRVRAWLGIVAMDTLPWLAHGLMMPAMLVPMLLRLDLYTGHATGAQMSTSAAPPVRADPSGAVRLRKLRDHGRRMGGLRGRAGRLPADARRRLDISPRSAAGRRRRGLAARVPVPRRPCDLAGVMGRGRAPDRPSPCWPSRTRTCSFRGRGSDERRAAPGHCPGVWSFGDPVAWSTPAWPRRCSHPRSR